MRSLSNRRRSWWALTIIFAMATTLVGSQITQAQPPAPAAKYIIYLPRVIGSAKTSPVDPAPVRFVNDLGRATHAAIGPEGGTLNATAADGTRFELEVPAEALDFAEVITMTPVLRAENLPLSGGLIGAVNLEPAGLELYAPATLRIIPSKLAPNLMTIGFAYNSTGEQFHLHPLAPAGNLQTQAEEIKITMEIVSIRPVGAGRGSWTDVEQQVAQPAPTDPIDAMEDDLVAEALDLLEKEVSRRAWVQDVHPLLLQALTDDQVVDAAIRRFDSWLQLVDSHGDRPRFFTQITEARELIGRIIPRASAAAAERCYSQKRPEEGFRLLRWMRYARKYLGSAEVAAIQAKLSKCLRFELTFYSHMTEGGYGDPYGYLYELQAKVTLRAASGMNATGAGPLEWQHVSWIGKASACTISVIGVDSTFDAQKPSFGLNITPVSRTSPAVNITLRYHPGTPGEQTTIQCPGGGGAGASTQAWATYFGQTHANERDGAGYRVTAQAVGAGSFPGWIYPHLTTSGPSNQAVIEATVIELVHAPER